jgi:exopolysaccharide biosynthesis polyprenyl glycosylphosphotransferase
MQNQSRNSHIKLVWLDALFAFGMALAAVVYGNSARIPHGGLDRFLQARITVINALFAGIFMLAWSKIFTGLHLYRSAESYGVLRKLIRIVGGCAVITLFLVAYLYMSHTSGPTARIAAIFFVSSICYEICRVLGATWIASRDPQLVVILGSGRRAGKAWRELRTRYHSTVKLIGFVDDRPIGEMAPDIAARYLGTTDDLSDLLLRNVVDELLIAVPAKSCYGMAQHAVSIAEKVGVHIVYMNDMFATTLKQTASRDHELFTDLVPWHDDYVTKQSIKRVIDILGALAGICILSPLLFLIAISIKATSKGPIFFVQSRFGHRRRLFRMYKFRSMVQDASELMAQMEDQNEAEGPIFKMRHDPRVTPLGRFLRTSSLDELPQLWNVLLGSMSLVGPRPMSVRDVSHFSEATLMRRFTVKPGITGLWQVSARNALNFNQWVKLDCSYIDDWSLGLDFVILAKTVTAVVKRNGAF